MSAPQMLSFENCPHVKDAHLAALAPLHQTLTALILNRCGGSSHLTSAGGVRSLAALTALQQLGLRDTLVYDEGAETHLRQTSLYVSNNC